MPAANKSNVYILRKSRHLKVFILNVHVSVPDKEIMTGREGTVLIIFVLPCPCRVEAACVSRVGVIIIVLWPPPPPQGYDPCNESLAVTAPDNNAAWLSIVNAMTTL